MTENRAAHEAATIEAMHTGDYAALTAYARTIADVDDAPEPPDLEYTPITTKLPPVTGEVAALREQITQLHCDYSGQIATLELRVRELDAWIAAVPSGALIDYYYGSGALSYDAREARPVVGAWIRRLEDENAIALREARP